MRVPVTWVSSRSLSSLALRLLRVSEKRRRITSEAYLAFYIPHFIEFKICRIFARGIAFGNLMTCFIFLYKRLLLFNLVSYWESWWWLLRGSYFIEDSEMVLQLLILDLAIQVALLPFLFVLLFECLVRSLSFNHL